MGGERHLNLHLNYLNLHLNYLNFHLNYLNFHRNLQLNSLTLLHTDKPAGPTAPGVKESDTRIHKDSQGHRNSQGLARTHRDSQGLSGAHRDSQGLTGTHGIHTHSHTDSH